MARTDPQLNIRIPADLKQRLEAAAKESGRSVTSEIITRLESTLTPTLPSLNGGVVISNAEHGNDLMTAIHMMENAFKALRIATSKDE